MEKTIFRPLQKIPHTELLRDIKTYIKNTHNFYQHKVPEMNIMAEKLHEEYSLNEFYSIFMRLWQRTNGERSLAIHALELYHDEFDIRTWEFLKSKLKNIKSLDEVDYIGKIISHVYAKNPLLKKEITALSENENIWIKRIGLLTMYYALKRKEIKDFNSPIKIIKNNIYDKDKDIQTVIGHMLAEIGKTKKEFLKKFILKHKDMPDNLFDMLTKKMKHLRKMRKLKKLNNT